MRLGSVCVLAASLLMASASAAGEGEVVRRAPKASPDASASATKKSAKKKRKKKRKKAKWVGDGVSDADMGFAVKPLAPDARAALGRKGGMVVSDVNPKGPAALAGLVVGDVLMSVGGHSVAVPRDAFGPLIDADAGDRVALSVVRDGKDLTIEIDAPEDAAERRARKAAEKQARAEEREEAAEAEHEAAQERADASYERRMEAEDQFTLGHCICCSLVFPGLAPVWVLLMLFVDGSPPPTRDAPEYGPRRAQEQRAVTVRY